MSEKEVFPNLNKLVRNSFTIGRLKSGYDKKIYETMNSLVGTMMATIVNIGKIFDTM